MEGLISQPTRGLISMSQERFGISDDVMTNRELVSTSR